MAVSACAVFVAFVVCFLVWAVFHGFSPTMLGVGCVVGVVGVAWRVRLRLV